jgi:hypothetical protein
MIERINLLDERIPVYFLHGEQSWIKPESYFNTQEKRKNIFVETIKEAGHHVCFVLFMSKRFFNSIFLDLC